jgi:hypothetical protein
MKSPHGLMLFIARILNPGPWEPIDEAAQARRRTTRHPLDCVRLEGRACPSQVTIVGPAYAVAQVSYGPQTPKTAWAKFGGVGSVNLGAPVSQQKANDGTNGLSTATFAYGQKPWQVVPGFNLAMDTSLGMARSGTSGKAEIATRTSPTMGSAQPITVHIDATGREVNGQAVTVSMRDLLTRGNSHLPATSAHVHYAVVYQGEVVRSYDGEVQQGKYFGTTFHARIGDTFQILIDCRITSTEYGTRGVGLALGVGTN